MATAFFTKFHVMVYGSEIGLAYDAGKAVVTKQCLVFNNGFAKLGRHDGVRGGKSEMGNHTKHGHI